MMRTHNRFQFHFKKYQQQALAREQKAARARQELLEEMREDAEFDRVHHVKERAACRAKEDPLARLDRLASALHAEMMEEDPAYAAEVAAYQAEKERQQALRNAAQLVQKVQSQHDEQVREAKTVLAQQYQHYRY